MNVVKFQEDIKKLFKHMHIHKNKIKSMAGILTTWSSLNEQILLKFLLDTANKLWW